MRERQGIYETRNIGRDRKFMSCMLRASPRGPRLKAGTWLGRSARLPKKEATTCFDTISYLRFLIFLSPRQNNHKLRLLRLLQSSIALSVTTVLYGIAKPSVDSSCCPFLTQSTISLCLMHSQSSLCFSLLHSSLHRTSSFSWIARSWSNSRFT